MLDIETFAKILFDKEIQEQFIRECESIGIVADEIEEIKGGNYESQNKDNKSNKWSKCCENCENFIPIGGGDFICLECGNKPTIVVVDYSPTEDYYKCNGKKWSKE